LGSVGGADILGMNNVPLDPRATAITGDFT
jgi:hypothetical protein